MLKRRAIFNFYRSMTDILILQETHSTSEVEEQWLREWGGRAIFSHGTSTSRGVCILFKKHFYCNITNISKDINGRYLACEIETESNFKAALIGIYAPNEDNPAFFEALEQNIAELHWNKILIGDFNLVLDVERDRHDSIYNNGKACNKLRHLMSEYDLEDVWRVRNPNTCRYSWQNLSKNRASRIDFCLIAKNIEALCENCMYMQGIKTDHSAMFISVKDNKHDRGPGYWKANSSLLKIAEVKSWIESEIRKDQKVFENKDPVDRWLEIKKRLKRYLQKAARLRADQTSHKISNLAEIITEYEETFPLSKSEQEAYNTAVIEFNDLLDLKARSIIFRSKVKWIEGGEKCTKYFLNMERLRSDRKSCKLLIRSDNSIAETLDDIMAEQVSFYRDLYKSDPSVKFCYENTTGVKLDQPTIDKLNQPPTKEELKKAVDAMAKGKSPGSDGITAEIYQELWSVLDDTLYAAMNKIYQDRRLYPEALNGILNLIPKTEQRCEIFEKLKTNNPTKCRL